VPPGNSYPPGKTSTVARLRSVDLRYGVRQSRAGRLRMVQVNSACCSQLLHLAWGRSFGITMLAMMGSLILHVPQVFVRNIYGQELIVEIEGVSPLAELQKRVQSEWGVSSLG